MANLLAIKFSKIINLKQSYYYFIISKKLFV